MEVRSEEVGEEVGDEVGKRGKERRERGGELSIM